MVDELGMLELPRRDVDRDLEIPTQEPTQARCVEARLEQDPASDLHDQARLLGKWDEVERGYLAERRVLPAQQGFESHHLERLEIDDRLVRQRELLLGDRLT